MSRLAHVQTRMSPAIVNKEHLSGYEIGCWICKEDDRPTRRAGSQGEFAIPRETIRFAKTRGSVCTAENYVEFSEAILDMKSIIDYLLLMQTLVRENANDLRVRNVPEPVFGAQDVLIGVRPCGTCGSDFQGYDGSTRRRIPPLTIGHESAGFVAKIGPEVLTAQVGDCVTFDSTVSCGRSLFCRMGNVNLSGDRQVSSSIAGNPGVYIRICAAMQDRVESLACIRDDR